ncbi:MAG: SDR family oxidoreductase, partial [Pseudomonadales bacterium]|nr:SDR family oxidoreductase [Pseudomonadales bacterium]
WAQVERENRPQYDSILASIPSGRFGTPQEVAELAVFLGSDAGRWITGQTIAVDGGQML